MPCLSSKCLTQAISQTSVSPGRLTLSGTTPLINRRSTSTARKQPVPTNHSTHQHSPVRTLFPPREPLTHNKQYRNNRPCQKQHPQRQTLDRRARPRIHRSAPAALGPGMCSPRRHRRHAVQDPRRRGSYHRRPNARRRWLRRALRGR